MTQLGDVERELLENQIKKEAEVAGTYSRYSSQAGDPRLSNLLNEFIQEKDRNIDSIRNLIGAPSQGIDAFEGQVYGRQAGGSNPGGYRQGGIAGTETSPTQPSTERLNAGPAGGNLGFEAAKLDFGWYDTDSVPDTRHNNYARETLAPAGGHIPWVTSDDDAIVRDVVASERELDASYSLVLEQLSRQTAGRRDPETVNAILRIQDRGRRRVERLLGGRQGR